MRNEPEWNPDDMTAMVAAMRDSWMELPHVGKDDWWRYEFDTQYLAILGADPYADGDIEDRIGLVSYDGDRMVAARRMREVVNLLHGVVASGFVSKLPNSVSSHSHRPGSGDPSRLLLGLAMDNGNIAYGDGMTSDAMDTRFGSCVFGGDRFGNDRTVLWSTSGDYETIGSVCDRGFDWLAGMIESFSSRSPSSGLTAAHAEDVRRRRDWRDPCPSAMLTMALMHMSDGGVDTSVMKPDAFGAALADSWLDIYRNGIDCDSVGVMPTLPMLVRWNHAIADGIDIPVCASRPRAVRWLMSYDDGAGLSGCFRYGYALLAALEFDGTPNYDGIIRAVEWRGGVPVPVALENGDEDADFHSMLREMIETGDSATIIGWLRLTDALVMAVGGDPANPLRTLDSGPLRWFPADSICEAAGLLRAGMPTDMIAESPCLHDIRDDG